MRISGESNRRIPGRSMAILVICMGLWCILIIRLFQLQIIDYDYYQNKVLGNVQRTTTLSATRGEIFDRNKNKLALNYTVYRVFISPRDIKDEAQKNLIADGLSEILQVDREKIITMAEKTYRADETVKKQASDEEADRVRRFILDNDLGEQVYLQAGSARYYPYGSLASNVIGVVGTDQGLTGLEYYYNGFLTGESGKYITARDASGAQMPTKYDTYIDASNGANLVTTIDVTIQAALEKQLRQTYLDSGPLNRCCGIVMDCNTGAVLAMGVYPSFDLNNPFVLDEDSKTKLAESGLAEDSEEYAALSTDLLYQLWKNKPVSELYEPGSTFKIITTAMALEEDLVTLDEEFTCTGSFYVKGYNAPIHCHKKKGHGTVTFERGLQQSCNPILMTIGLRLGENTFYKYFRSFGYTGITGIDLPGESQGIVGSLANFEDVNLAVYSFGQTFKITPIMHISAISAVANGGYLLTPYVVEQIVDDDGNILMQHEPDVKRQIISSGVCETIAGVLERGVSGDGGAKNAHVAGYKIAAKTGTSEIRDTKEATDCVGSTVAYAPADDPQVIALIIVDTPTCKNQYGSTVAAPYISALMEEILPYIGIEHNYTEEEYSSLVGTVTKRTGWPIAEAVKALERYGIRYEVRGTGDKVTFQVPAPGSDFVYSTNKIIYYTGDATPLSNIVVPNVVGKTVSNANHVLTSAGFNVVIKGALVSSASTEAEVVSQSLKPGTLATEAAVCTITVRYMDGTAN